MGSAEDQAIIWAIGAKEWVERRERFSEPLWLLMMAMGGVVRGKRFLDAGCGGGGASVIAHRLGAIVSGFDATPEFINICRERLPGVKFDLGDLEDLPYADGSFDVVFAANSLQFTYDPAKALSEFKRVLAPHGKAVVAAFTEVQRNDMASVMMAMRSLAPEPPKVGPFALGKRELVEAAIRTSGIKLLRWEEIPFDIVYPNLDDCWETARSTGSLQAMINLHGEQTVREAHRTAHLAFVQPGGEVHLKNYSRVLVLGA